LQEYHFLTEEHLQINDSPAYCVFGQGQVNRETRDSWKVKIRQVIVDKGDRFWLISTFVDEAMPESFAEVLDKSIKTFQLEG